MSVSNQTNKVSGAGNGVTVTFSFNFKVLSESDLYVYLINDTSGAVTGPLVLNTDYTVEINTISEGGTITFLTAPASGVTWFVRRIVPFTQSAVIQTEGTLPGTQLENQLDLTAMMNIQMNEAVNRALQLRTTSTFSGPVFFEDPEDGYILQYSSTLGRYVNVLMEGGETFLPNPGDAPTGLLRANSAGNAFELLVANLADSFLAQITTAGKVSGAALTALSSIVSGAGRVPIANLASGTATGLKYIRDDGSLQVTPDIKIATVSRDLTAASGNVTITGVGFTPRFVIVIGAGEGLNSFSIGFDDATTHYTIYGYLDTSTKFGFGNSKSVLLFATGSSNGQDAAFTSFNSDGGVLAWTKTGTPTGTVNLIMLFIK